jgi:hypothetical protein
MSLKSFFNLLLLIAIIITSGFSAFFALGHLLIYLLPLSLYLAVTRKLQFHLKEFIPLAISLFVIVAQSISSGTINFNIIIVKWLNLIFLFVSAKIIINDFADNLIRFSFYISLISLLLWTLMQINPNFTNNLLTLSYSIPQLSSADDLGQLQSGVRHIFIFSIPEDGDVTRNSGPFYEPGRFVIFILISLGLELYKKNSIKKALSFKNFILFITTLTTFSTTGYFAFVFLFLSWLLFFRRFRFINILASLLFLLVVVYSLNFDFLLPKVMNDLDSDSNSSRFNASIYHFGLILSKPIFGWGKGMSGIIELSPNGLTQLVVVWGILFSSVYYLYLFRGCKIILLKNNIKAPPYFLFMLLVILAFSQSITLDPFYFLLMFFGALKTNGKVLANGN